MEASFTPIALLSQGRLIFRDANDVDYYFNFKGSTVDLSDQPKVLLHMATRLSRFITHLKKEELFGEDFGLKSIHISLVIMFLFGINHPDNMGTGL